jgi:hypothetical protein
MARTVPETALSIRYKRIKGMTVAERRDECERLARCSSELVDDFLRSLDAMRAFENRDEGFHPPGRKANPVDRPGTVRCMKFLMAGPVSVVGQKGYSFRIVDTEIAPLRARNAGAPRSGAGGIDYVAIVEGPPVVPVIGEVKAGNDGDAFYAFVQLLTYLAWMCPEAQLARATTHLFRQSLPSPTRWDLHLLLCDRNKRSAKERLVGPTEELAQRFSQEVRFRMAEQTPLGRILCLRMGEMSTKRTIELVWACGG